MSIAFFFLLRVGEYTPSPQARDKLTIPLRKRDIRLWQGDDVIAPDAPWDVLQHATGVSICLENQKNGHKMAPLHHDSSGDPEFCPVRALARRVHELRDTAPDTPIGTYFDEADAAAGGVPPRQVQASEIRAAIRLGAAGDGLEQQGYDASRIGSHSLRSGGAVALFLSGYPSELIQKLGRWRSETYKRYIQAQIAQLTAGVSSQMALYRRFTNVSR